MDLGFLIGGLLTGLVVIILGVSALCMRQRWAKRKKGQLYVEDTSLGGVSVSTTLSSEENSGIQAVGVSKTSALTGVKTPCPEGGAPSIDPCDLQIDIPRLVTMTNNPSWSPTINPSTGARISFESAVSSKSSPVNRTHSGSMNSPDSEQAPKERRVLSGVVPSVDSAFFTPRGPNSRRQSIDSMDDAEAPNERRAIAGFGPEVGVFFTPRGPADAESDQQAESDLEAQGPVPHPLVDDFIDAESSLGVSASPGSKYLGFASTAGGSRLAW